MFLELEKIAMCKAHTHACTHTDTDRHTHHTLSFVKSDSQFSFGLEMGFIDHLQVVTTKNYNTVYNFHSSQITTAHPKSFQSAFTSLFPVTDLNNGDSSASVLMLLLSVKYPTTQLLLQLANLQAGSHLTPTS
jgi:hypothetical protein